MLMAGWIKGKQENRENKQAGSTNKANKVHKERGAHRREEIQLQNGTEKKKPKINRTNECGNTSE